MFCQNCGTQLPEGSRFCPECGTPVTATPIQEEPPLPQFVQQEPQYAWAESQSVQPESQYVQPESRYIQPESQYAQPEPVPAQPEKKPKKGLIIGLIIGGAVLLTAIIVALLLILLPILRDGKKVTIDFTRYAEVEFDGYDNVGTAESRFNEEQFLEDYGDKIKYSNEYKDLTDDPARELLDYYVYCYLDQNYSDLSNGDEVICWLYVDAEAEEVFNISIDDGEKMLEDGGLRVPFTVTGLDETPAFDPFNGLKFVYLGFEPYGELYLDWSECPVVANVSYPFSPPQFYDLSNGDVVTIKLDDYYDDNYFMSTYGMIPSRRSMEYTVEGVPVLLTSLYDISSSDLDELRKVCDDIYLRDYIGSDDPSISTNSFGCVGMILKVAKDAYPYTGDNNALYLVYQQNCTVSDDEGIVPDEDFSSYAAIRFDEVTLSDGKLQYDPDDYSEEYNFYEITAGLWTISGSYGYATLEDLKEDIINENDSYYTYDSNFSF